MFIKKFTKYQILKIVYNNVHIEWKMVLFYVILDLNQPTTDNDNRWHMKAETLMAFSWLFDWLVLNNNISSISLYIYCGENKWYKLILISRGLIEIKQIVGCWVRLWCLTPLSTIFQLYSGGQFYLWTKTEWVTGKNHRSAASHWQTLSHNVVSSIPRHERDSNSQL